MVGVYSIGKNEKVVFKSIGKKQKTKENWNVYEKSVFDKIDVGF